MAQTGDRTLAERVKAHMRQICSKRGWSLYQLAQKIDVDASTLYKVFSGARGVGIDLLFALHRGLHLPADMFLDDDPPAEYFKPSADEGRRGRRPAQPMPVEAAEAAEYVNALPAADRRKALDAVRKMVPKLKREHEQKKSG